ncbi:glycosyl hydrolase family 28-related protein [Arthrobacter crystallopoietes]|uniref:glycosyl hydrolase family 28-related protein n=1 Tax=Crystallibacter crystallopoietes TaxID=37928 RepID=UPI000B1CA406|nr:glycosyl hydrolase family 28-related protein [Arthrobacter crystallopoietes]
MTVLGEIQAALIATIADEATTIKPGGTIIDAVSNGVDNTGATDAWAAIAALAASATAGDIVYLRPGTYSITSSGRVELPAGVTLRGAGKATKILRKNWTLSSIIRGKGVYTPTPTTTLTADAVRGAKTLTVASTTGIKAGDHFILGVDRLFTPTSVANAGEYVRVMTVNSATQITLHGAVRDNYAVAAEASLRKVVMHEGGGVESMLFADSEPGQHSAGNVEFKHAKNITHRDVHSDGCGGHKLITSIASLTAMWNHAQPRTSPTIRVSASSGTASTSSAPARTS